MALMSSYKDWSPVFRRFCDMPSDLGRKDKIRDVYEKKKLIPENDGRFNHELLQEAIDEVLGMPSKPTLADQLVEEYEMTMKAMELMESL